MTQTRNELANRVTNLEVRMTNVENSMAKIENTLLREGSDTRKTLNDVITHAQNMEKIKMQLWLQMVGSGGILYVIIEIVSQLIKK